MKRLFDFVFRFISREILLYLIFGVLTTAVNILSFAFLTRCLSLGTILSNVIAWFLSVLFAYATNRKWVFQSDAKGFSAVFKETVGFFSGRITTGIFDTCVMYVFVDLLNFNDMLMKVISNLIVIVLNYIISKFLIFKKSTREGKDEI